MIKANFKWKLYLIEIENLICLEKIFYISDQNKSFASSPYLNKDSMEDI